MYKMRTLIAVLCIWAIVSAAAEESKHAPEVEDAIYIPVNVTELNDAGFLEAYNSGEPWLIHFYATFCGKPCDSVNPTLEQVAGKYKGTLNVGRVVHNLDALLWADVIEYPTIVLMKNKKYYRFAGDRTVEGLEAFVQREYKEHIAREIVPQKYDSYVHELNESNFDRKVFSRKGAYWVVLFYRREDFKEDNLEAVYQGLGIQLKGKINVGQMEVKKNRATPTRFGITHTPATFVVRGGKVYSFEKSTYQYNAIDLELFAEGGYKNSTLIKDLGPVKQSAEEEGDVVILNEENFDEETGAMKGDKGTWFVEFYAPWCGHCKALTPIWDEVATELKEKMKVAKLDCIENKNISDRFGIPGFPTLLLFKDKKFYRYDGQKRLKESFIKFALEDYKEKEGLPVPPPKGTPLPPPTVAEELSEFYPAFQDVYAGTPFGVHTLAGFSFVVGFCITAYILIFKWLVVLSLTAAQSLEKPQASEKKVRGKKSKTH